MKRQITSPAFRNSANPAPPFQPLDNLAKKRPSSTKLDIEKMYQESLELASRHKQLQKQNQQLKEEYAKVQAIKLSRQNLISTVEKIVAQKSKQIRHRNKNKQKFSWLVHNLGNKITDLKSKIQNKEKAIQDLLNSKQTKIIQEKQTQIQRLNNIIQNARQNGSYRQGIVKDPAELSEIKQIVWMEQQLREKQVQISQAQLVYKQGEQEVKALMQQLASKKAELKSIKDMEAEYTRAQQLYKQQKRKKQQRIAGNKTYLEQLQHQKAEEVIKLQKLKNKFSLIEAQEQQAINDLHIQLQSLRNQYHERMKVKKETCIKLSEKQIPQSNKKQVKRVNYDQIKPIAGNLSYTLALKEIPHSKISGYFEFQGKEQLSIQQVTEILQNEPFSLEDHRQALLLARYVIEDAGDGYFLQDMDTSQSVCIIKCIMGKVIEQVRIFEREKAQIMRKQVGPILSKFYKLVQQSLDMKEGVSLRQTGKTSTVSREIMIEALQNSLSSLQSETFLHEQIDFTILYLFSWSHNLEHLEVKRLSSMLQQGINWPQKK